MKADNVKFKAELEAVSRKFHVLYSTPEGKLMDEEMFTSNTLAELAIGLENQGCRVQAVNDISR